MRNIYISYSVTDVSYDIEVYVINQNNKNCGGMLFVEMCELIEIVTRYTEMQDERNPNDLHHVLRQCTLQP